MFEIPFVQFKPISNCTLLLNCKGGVGLIQNVFKGNTVVIRRTENYTDKL